MIGCLNINGHDCGKSDMDTVSFVPLDVLEDAEIRRQVGLEALIYDPFNEDRIAHGIDMREGDDLDHNFEEVFWSSLTLGADYDWNDAPEEDIEDWLQRRYGDVIELNNKLGFASTSNVVPLRPSFVGQSRTNVREIHWSDKRSLRECSLTYDKRRGKACRK